MRILVSGATGTAGAAAVRQAIRDQRVERVTALSRRELPIQNRKLTTVIVRDFLDLSSVREQLSGHHAALWCLGTSQRRVSREELHRITVDFALAGAKALHATNPGIKFLHLSGAGADPNGRSRMAFAKEKGEAETRLDALGLPGLWHFRPGYIHSPGRAG